MRVRGRLAMRACFVFALTLLTAPPAAAVPADQAASPVGEPAGANWAVYGGNLFNQRYSSLDQINTGNVANLKGAWTYHTGGNSSATSFESSPVVVDGTMYVTGPQSQVYALDATNGGEKWRYVPEYSALA